MRSLCLMVFVASAAVATPVPKPKEKADLTDLKKLHERITEAVDKDNWTDDDTKHVEDVVTATLAKLTNAAGTDDRPLPVAFKDLKRTTVKELHPTGGDGVFLVCDDIHVTSFRNSVVISSGKVVATSFENCIVIARQVDCTGAGNSVVIADEYALANGWGGGKRGDCVVIAGERVWANTMGGGFVHILRPGTGRPPRGDRREDKPIAMTRATGVTFFGTEEKLRFGTKDCKWVELKAPVAK